ncbi:Nif3-like dinuclear metal center hexameric protein [Thioalkalivibrio sp.]|uniref:Nif3-like dinuclear metal center hexameric protein n=1 Tax=Thioalkalivibrio sp. TaxID=2093813 RepID=UPI00356496B2
MPATIARDTLLEALDRILEPERFEDYCPNGLQVEGRPEIRRIISGVTASHALIRAAAEQEADLILVHHGYFWRGEPQPVVGMKRRRLQALLQHDINLVAYHLPLDAHPELGNNAQLGLELGLVPEGSLRPDGIGLVGRLPEPCPPEQLAIRIGAVLGRQPTWVQGGAHPVRRLAWCTGGAQSMLATAAGHGVDAFISGEISEQTTHEARELGVHYFAAGHHATERYGPRALGAWCAERFGVDHRFIDIPNPA